jgi:hypothetical protein
MSKKPEPTNPPKPRTPASPDIQALARIDRILATLPVEVATRTLKFLVAKYDEKVMDRLNEEMEHATGQ